MGRLENSGVLGIAGVLRRRLEDEEEEEELDDGRDEDRIDPAEDFFERFDSTDEIVVRSTGGRTFSFTLSPQGRLVIKTHSSQTTPPDPTHPPIEHQSRHNEDIFDYAITAHISIPSPSVA